MHVFMFVALLVMVSTIIFDLINDTVSPKK